MKTTLIVLTVVFMLLNVILTIINNKIQKYGCGSSYDLFWLDRCLVSKEVEILFCALAWLTSFFLVEHTVLGPVFWGYVALVGVSSNSWVSFSHWDWYKNHCWKREKKHYLSAFIVSVLSNLIWLFIGIVVLTQFIMFILEAQPWNR